MEGNEKPTKKWSSSKELELMLHTHMFSGKCIKEEPLVSQVMTLAGLGREQLRERHGTRE